MSTEQTWQLNTDSVEATLDVANHLGSRLKGGEVIELVSDLGGGKTTFVKGLAQGLGSPDKVHSPSFTLNNQYRAKDKTLHHFDFYRLKEPGILEQELAEILAYPKAIVVIEWGNIIHDVLPRERLTAKLKVTGEASRELRFTYPARYNYLFPQKATR